jgi:hypothetical protein
MLIPDYFNNLMNDFFFGLGDLNDAKVQDILSNYEKNFESNMSKHESEKDRQAAELRHKLAEKRKRKEAQLREKHNREV